MFSENNQISGRQVFRLLTYDFLGMGTLLLPTMLADTAGRDGIFCILAGILSTFLYLKLLRYLLKGMKTSYPDFLKQKCGKSDRFFRRADMFFVIRHVFFQKKYD